MNSTTGKVFSANETDQQVMKHEKMHPEDWQVALTTTEFLIAPNLRQTLWTLSSSTTGNETEQIAKSFVAAIPIMRVDGNNTAPVSYSMPLPKQRFEGTFNITPENLRFLHYKTTDTHKYKPGYHVYTGSGH